MKTNSVLEIPVFGAHEDYFNQISELKNKINEKKYHDFLLKEYELDSEHIIYFYCMDYIPDSGNASLVDQIVPKSPFVFFLLDDEEGMQQETTIQLLQKYTELYSTPVFVIVKKDQQEFYTIVENDPIIKANDFRVIVIEESEQNITSTILSQAINNVIPANI